MCREKHYSSPPIGLCDGPVVLHRHQNNGKARSFCMWWSAVHNEANTEAAFSFPSVPPFSEPINDSVRPKIGFHSCHLTLDFHLEHLLSCSSKGFLSKSNGFRSLLKCSGAKQSSWHSFSVNYKTTRKWIKWLACLTGMIRVQLIALSEWLYDCRLRSSVSCIPSANQQKYNGCVHVYETPCLAV